jgi:hypothetical protein
MAEAITDRHVVAVLRPIVHGTRPLLDALRESDPFGLRERVRTTSDDVERGLTDRILDWAATVQVPGTAAWAAMDARERSDWWIGRVGRVHRVARRGARHRRSAGPAAAGAGHARARRAGAAAVRDRRGARGTSAGGARSSRRSACTRSTTACIGRALRRCWCPP